METQETGNKNLLGIRNMMVLFLLSGLFGLVSGLIHFSNLMTEYSGIVLADAIFNTAIGVINLICGYLLRKRNALVIWVFGLEAIAMQIYAPMIGRGINIPMLVISVLVFTVLFSFKNKGAYQQE